MEQQQQKISAICDEIWSCFEKNKLNNCNMNSNTRSRCGSICDCLKNPENEFFFTCENSSSRHEVGTENNLSFLNHFMGTYDMFLTDLEYITDYKSVALPIEL